jgi:RHS repeat-associated protein
MKELRKNRAIYTRLIAIAAVLLLLAQNIFGATDQAPDRGYASGKSYSITNIETISVQTGNLMFNIPVGSLPAGRGGLSGGITLFYNSKLWDLEHLEVADHYGIDVDATAVLQSPEGGWHYGYKYYFTQEKSENCTQRSMLVTPDGARHLLLLGNGVNGDGDGTGGQSINYDGTGACSGAATTGGQTILWLTTDNTFLRVEVLTDSDTNGANNQWTVYLPDGSRIVNNPTSGVAQRRYDRNGNFIDIIENSSDSNYSSRQTTYLKDNQDRKVVIEYNTGTGGVDQDTIHTLGFDGEDLQTKVVWKNIIVNQVYEYSDGVPPSPLPSNAWSHFPLNKTLRVVDKVHLPTITSFDPYYEFSYNADSTSATDTGWGEVSGVRIPSAATTDYDYQYDSINGWIMDPETLMRNGVVTKTLAYDLEYDGSTNSTTDTWTYARTGTDPVTSASVTGPDGGVMTEYYKDTTISGLQVKGEVVKTVSADGSVVEKVYATNSPGAPSNSAIPNPMVTANRYVKYEIVSIPDNSGTLTKTTFKEYSRDKNGNTTEVKEYDYVATSSITIPRDSGGFATGLPSGISSALKRITKTEYYNDTPDASSTTYSDADSYHVSTSPRLLGLTKSVEVQDASNNPKSRSELSYDYTSYSSNTKGGNLTETKSWDSYKGGTTRSYSNPLTSTNSISTSATYDSYGNPTQTTDANGVETTITYGCIDGQTSCSSSPWLENLYPTKIETASNYSSVKRTATSIYDFSTGLTTSATDVDNSVTTETTYDDLGRPTKVAAAVGEDEEVWTQTDYNDQYRRVIVKSDLETKGDARKVATQFYDQLGRVRLSKTLEDSSTQSATNETDGIKVQTRYAASGACTFDSSKTCSYQLTSNPYRANYSNNASSETTMGWTRSQTINTGKHSEVETFSGTSLPAPWGSSSNSTGVVKTDTDADRALVTDQAGKQRISKSNAFGQLTDVWEVVSSSDSATVSTSFPNQSGIAYGYHTSYSYDLLNNLTEVYQPIGTSGGQTRSFSYSTLSRLLSASNPESGTISYSYDNNGNLSSKTDARSISTSYTYDALNRVTVRDYSDSTPDALYTYDNVTNAKGKLTKVTNGTLSGGTISTPFSITDYQVFDKLGRVTQSQQSTDGTTYTAMTYTYNLSGALIEETYPSGRKVKNVLDNNGDLSMVQSKKSSNYGYWNYAQNFTYTAAGAVSSMQLGNFRWESAAFNSRLQPTRIALGATQSAYDILKLDFTYNTTGNADNNGNVLTQTITVPTVGSNTGFTAVQTYTYDSLNRIHDATENLTPTGGTSAQTWKQTFTYDRFGNRNFDEVNTTAGASFPKSCGTSPNLTMCAADKKIYNPDINTAMDNRLNTSDGYTFDNSGNTTKDAQSRKFTYDAENKQIKVETLDSNGNVTGTIGEYSYDGDGKRVKKYVPSTGETTIFVYDASGKLVEEYSTIVAAQQDAKVSYLTNDHLGSPRINTDEHGAVTARHDYQPFGEEITRANYGADSVRKQFTSYERDKETELDYAKARMFESGFGRFTSPDPLLTSGKIENPQTWNRYIYVLNNPLVFIDPLGLYTWGESAGGSYTDDDLLARSQDKSLKKKDRHLAQRQYNFRQKFKTALEAAKNLDTSNLTPQQAARLARAINSYGELGDTTNNVRVGAYFNKQSGKPVNSNPSTDLDTEQGHIDVIFNFNQAMEKNSNGFIIDITHEGSHTADFTEWARNRGTGDESRFDVSNFETERRAYLVGSYTAQALGMDSYNTTFGKDDRTWEKGWTEAERDTAARAFVHRHYTNINGDPLTENNSWSMSTRGH